MLCQREDEWRRNFTKRTHILCIQYEQLGHAGRIILQGHSHSNKNYEVAHSFPTHIARHKKATALSEQKLKIKLISHANLYVDHVSIATKPVFYALLEIRASTL